MVAEKVYDVVKGHDDAVTDNGDTEEEAEKVDAVTDNGDTEEEAKKVNGVIHGHDEAITDNGDAEKVDETIHGHDEVLTDNGEAEAERVEIEKEKKKPSFKDILKLNPKGFENKRPEVVKVRQSSVKPVVASVRVAEKKASTADRGEDVVRQKIDLKQAVWKEAKEVYEAAVRDEMALRILLEEKNVKIGETRSVLKRFMAGAARKGSKMSLPDGMEDIYNALASSGIGIHDLDKEELADELLKPLMKEVASLKESIQKAEEFTEGLKKKYDNRTEELETLRVQLREAGDVNREASENLMRLLNNKFTEEKEGLVGAMEDENSCNLEQTVESSFPTYCTDQTSENEDGSNNKELAEVGDRDLTKDTCKKVESSEIKVEPAGEETTNNDYHNNQKTQRASNNKRNQNRRARRARAKTKKSDDVLTLPEHPCTKVCSCLDSSTLTCVADQTSKKEGSNSEKAIENENICIELTMDSSGLTCYADQTSEKDEGRNSEKTMVSEHGSPNKELNEARDGDSAEGALKEEVEKVELVAIEPAEEETSNSDHHNYQPEKTQRSSNNKKKQKRRARKARAKAEKDDDYFTLPGRLCARIAASFESPQVCFALAFLSFIGILLNLRSLFETL